MKTHPLAALKHQIDMVRARVLGAANGFSNGLLLFGPPGVGKSFLVEETLRKHEYVWADSPKGLTPQGLLDFLKQHGDGIMVFDDVAELFRNDRCRKYMMAACGNRPNHTEPRVVSYQREGKEIQVVITGCCIILTNDARCPEAFASRISVLEYNPPQEQVFALMKKIISHGVKRDKWHLTARECLMVLEFLVEEATSTHTILDMRDLLEKALPDYAMWKAGLSEVFWKDMLHSHLSCKAA